VKVILSFPLAFNFVKLFHSQEMNHSQMLAAHCIITDVMQLASLPHIILLLCTGLPSLPPFSHLTLQLSLAWYTRHEKMFFITINDLFGILINKSRNPLNHSGYYMYHLLNIRVLKLLILRTDCYCVSYGTINGDYFPKQH
jgi:hypothetical protein